MLKKNAIVLILTAYAVIAWLTIVFFDGTGDSGDSVLHFLFAKYALKHPANFFDHWAKPLYVLLACPFAQFGFAGIKVFNAVNTFFTMLLTYKIARKLSFSNAAVAALILLVSPSYYILTFSGLTEPLFALFFAAGIYLVLEQKHLLACIVISFLPYVRSEGLIIAGAFGLYYLSKKEIKLLPYLAFGSLIYGIGGFFIYHDLLWVFKKIPYANMGSPYGHGAPFDFVEQLIYITGLPVYVLFWIGLLVVIVKTVQRKTAPENSILICFGFCAFFIAHSLFWWLGIFNSMGLKRVLVSVMPAIGIIALQGFNFIYEDLGSKRKNVQKFVGGALLLYLVVFPFTPNPAAINWKKDMCLSPDQELAVSVKKFLDEKKPNHGQLFFAHHYLGLVFEVDRFDKNSNPDLSENNLARIKPGDIVIWDNWHTELKKQQFDRDSSFSHLYDAKHGAETVFAVYEYSPVTGVITGK